MEFWHRRFVLLFSIVMVVVGSTSCKKEAEPALVLSGEENEPAAVPDEPDEIRFNLIDEETLEISGHGELKEIDHEYWCHDGEKNKYRIRTLIVKEGIIKVSFAGTSMEYVQEVFLPDSLKEIDEGAFGGFGHLRRVSFGNGLKRIGKGAFASCCFLEQALLPDSVEEIGAYAFRDDIRLKKIVIPASLLRWDQSAIRSCFGLKEVENHSALSCDMYRFGKYVTWRVEEKEVKAIPGGKTGMAEGAEITIQYDLDGGVADGMLPRYFQFGTEMKIPGCVKKEGYEFICWCENTLGFFMDTIEPGRKKAAVFALWFRAYTVESRKKGEVTITVDTTGSYSGYEGFDIRYSANKDMSHAVYLPKGIVEKGSRTAKNLKSGQIYYFQIGGWGDSEWVEESDNSLNDQDWIGMRKVVVK